MGIYLLKYYNYKYLVEAENPFAAQIILKCNKAALDYLLNHGYMPAGYNISKSIVNKWLSTIHMPRSYLEAGDTNVLKYHNMPSCGYLVFDMYFGEDDIYWIVKADSTKEAFFKLQYVYLNYNLEDFESGKVKIRDVKPARMFTGKFTKSAKDIGEMYVD